MDLAHRRHDISDELWNKISHYLPGAKGKWGGVAQDNRSFVNAVIWIFRTWGVHGEIYHMIMGIGKILIEGFVDGATSVFGSVYSKYLSMILIMNGL